MWRVCAPPGVRADPAVAVSAHDSACSQHVGDASACRQCRRKPTRVCGWGCSLAQWTPELILGSTAIPALQVRLLPRARGRHRGIELRKPHRCGLTCLLSAGIRLRGVAPAGWVLLFWLYAACNDVDALAVFVCACQCPPNGDFRVVVYVPHSDPSSLYLQWVG